MVNINYFWQISKYQDDELPLYNEDSKPVWTSVSDIGKSYNNKIVTVNDYLNIEDKVVRSIQAFVKCSKSSEFIVEKFENPINLQEIEKDSDRKGFSNEQSIEMFKFFQRIEKGMKIHSDEIEWITRLALREYIWVQLKSDSMFIRFDYDYYTDIGTIENCEEAVKQICEMDLVINRWDEPYPFYNSID